MSTHSKSFRRRNLVGAMAGSAVLGAVGVTAQAAPAGKPIRVGSTLSLTGPLAQTALLHKTQDS